jgi:hypothetical protein
MSIEFLDLKGEARLKIEPPVQEFEGTVSYRSRLTTKEDTSSMLGLFDQTDESSMYYFQRGFQPEIMDILESSTQSSQKALRAIGYDYDMTERITNGQRILNVRQNIPDIAKWNSIFEKSGIDLLFSEVDYGLYNNSLAEELYFEDRIIPISNAEPWRFHDLSIHPIGHFLITGELMTNAIYDASEIKEEYSSKEQRKDSLDNSLWYNIDNFTEEIAYSIILGKTNKIESRITNFIRRIGFCIPRIELESYNSEYLKDEAILTLTQEVFERAEEFNNLGGR